MAQNGQKCDPVNFNSSFWDFPGQMVKNGEQHPDAAWIELSENENFKKIGPLVPKLWAEKGPTWPFFYILATFLVL